MLITSWVYPWVISFHSIGMGFLVGVIAMIALRTLGFGSYAISHLERFLIIVRIAFVVNVASGLTLFMIQAENFYYSPTFRIKILCILLGIATGWMLSKRIFGPDAGEPEQATKIVAGLTLFFWAGAIVAGRMTAYLP